MSRDIKNNSLKFFTVLFFFSFLSLEVYGQDYFEEAEQEMQSEKKEEVGQIEKLDELEKFKDIAVIQKKYLNKTGRFELWLAGSLALNSQYFNMLGGNLALSYHFNDRWGVELEGVFMTDMEKSVTEGLRKDQAITTRDIITPTSYMGLNLRWSPIYGKMSLREKTINPFEVYFVLGAGLTGTDDGQSAFTIHGGIGQVYPVSKNMSIRWTLVLNNFAANAKGDLKGSIKGQEVRSNLLYLSAGVSWFFPFSEER